MGVVRCCVKLVLGTRASARGTETCSNSHTQTETETYNVRVLWGASAAAAVEEEEAMGGMRTRRWG